VKLSRRVTFLFPAALLAGAALAGFPAFPNAAAMAGAARPAVQIATPACGDVEFPAAATGSWVIPGGGVNVFSNGSADEGTGSDCATGQSTVNGVPAGEKWQCPELINRLYLSRGWISATWKGDAGQPMWDNTPGGLSKQANGSVSYLGPGDVVIINVYLNGSFEGGHALIVNDTSDVTSGTVSLVSQNSGYLTNSEPVVPGTLSGGSVTVGGGGNGWTYTTIGVVHAPAQTSPPPPVHRAPFDVNGDGDADMCFVSGLNGGVTGSGDLEVHCAYGPSFNTRGDFATTFADRMDTTHQQVFFADVNGDGDADMCFVSGLNGGVTGSGDLEVHCAYGPSFNTRGDFATTFADRMDTTHQQVLDGPPATSSLKPGQPARVSATPGDHLAVVSWTSPAFAGGSSISGYTVTSDPGRKTCTSAAAKQCTLAGLANGTTYTFTVVAENNAGSGPASMPSNPVTPAGPPPAPRDLVTKALKRGVRVSWSPPSTDNGSPVTSYVLEWRSCPFDRVCATHSSTVTGTSDKLTGLRPRHRYFFRVAARNRAGRSSFTSPRNAIPSA
jgi:fibronectin type III domain protein